MKKEIKFILGDIQEIVSDLLPKSKFINGKFINESILYDIIFFIESKEVYENNKKQPAKIYLSEFEKVTGLSEHVVNRHIDWLLENGIVWRNALSYSEVNGVKKRNPYTYSINFNLQITNYQRFIYSTLKDFKNLKDLSVELKNITEVNAYSNLMKMNIDLESALKSIYNSNKKAKGKRLQSLFVYQMALQKFYISQKENGKRMFHTVTSLTKSVHDHLYIDGVQVSEIDAKQSQLVLLSILVKNIDTQFFLDAHTTYIYDSIIDYYKRKIERENLINNTDSKFAYFDEADKIWKYIDFEEITKDIIKPQMYAALFGGFGNDKNPVTQYFEFKYPVLVDYIRKNYPKENSLASKLQEMEASVWLKAFNNLNEMGINCLPKHDSLLFKEKDAHPVLMAVIDAYEAIGLIISQFDYKKYLEITYRFGSKFEFEKPEIIILDDFKTEESEIQSEIQSGIVQMNTDFTQYSFESDKGDSFKGLKSEFVKKYNLDKSAINKMINGKRKSVKGWVLK